MPWKEKQKNKAMTIFEKIQYYCCHPNRFATRFLIRFNRFFSDRVYLKLFYRLKMGRRLNLTNPKRFSEKLQWLKLYDRKPEYTKMVDKITAKEFVAKKIGNQYIIPTLGTWSRFEEIDFDMLPNKFVLKTNNGGGSSGVIICKDKTLLDKKTAKQKLDNSLKQNIYQFLREWPYKDVEPKILAEELLEDFGPHGLMDYKVFCCEGEPRMVKVNYDVATDYHVSWYDLDWNKIEGTTIFDPIDNSVDIARPALLDELLDKSRILSKGTHFLRVDFYCVNGGLRFGELTFFPGSGFEPFEPDTFDIEIGQWIKLPN